MRTQRRTQPDSSNCMNSVDFWWFLDIYRTTQVANRLHTWNAVPFVAFESIKQISMRSCPQSARLSLSLLLYVCVCFRFLTIAWSHIPRPQGVWNGRLPEISISRKSALLSRHNSMGFICVCYFFSFLFVAAVIFHFDFALPPTTTRLPSPSPIVFYSYRPRGQSSCRWSSASSLCVCRQFRPSNLY